MCIYKSQNITKWNMRKTGQVKRRFYQLGILATIHFSLFTFHFSLFTFHFSLFTFHFSLFDKDWILQFKEGSLRLILVYSASIFLMNLVGGHHHIYLKVAISAQTVL
jgi:hypothetical protein